MFCPVCGKKSVVLDVRHGPDESIRKRRCTACNKIFYTSEIDIDLQIGKQLLRYYQYGNKKDLNQTGA